MSLLLTTAELVRQFKGWKSDSDPNDAWINAAIAAVSARVQNDLRRNTTQEAVTETLDVAEGDVIVPPPQLADRVLADAHGEV